MKENIKIFMVEKLLEVLSGGQISKNGITKMLASVLEGHELGIDSPDDAVNIGMSQTRLQIEISAGTNHEYSLVESFLRDSTEIRSISNTIDLGSVFQIKEAGKAIQDNYFYIVIPQYVKLRTLKELDIKFIPEDNILIKACKKKRLGRTFTFNKKDYVVTHVF